jgi:hypothetical protein
VPSTAAAAPARKLPAVIPSPIDVVSQEIAWVRTEAGTTCCITSIALTVAGGHRQVGQRQQGGEDGNAAGGKQRDPAGREQRDRYDQPPVQRGPPGQHAVPEPGQHAGCAIHRPPVTGRSVPGRVNATVATGIAPNTPPVQNRAVYRKRRAGMCSELVASLLRAGGPAGSGSVLRWAARASVPPSAQAITAANVLVDVGIFSAIRHSSRTGFTVALAIDVAAAVAVTAFPRSVPYSSGSDGSDMSTPCLVVTVPTRLPS